MVLADHVANAEAIGIFSWCYIIPQFVSNSHPKRYFLSKIFLIRVRKSLKINHHLAQLVIQLGNGTGSYAVKCLESDAGQLTPELIQNPEESLYEPSCQFYCPFSLPFDHLLRWAIRNVYHNYKPIHDPLASPLTLNLLYLPTYSSQGSL